MPDAFNSVEPAQLSFLAIYNPRLGPTDETIQDQVVFYTSKSSRSRRIESSTVTNDDKEVNGEWNERLRQIGLAQGMVSFARNFSQGKAIDYVETGKSLIVLHELEKDWWVVASIDLTRLPNKDASQKPSSQRDSPDTPTFHYSSREICPPSLLIQQLRRAHSLFLLQHDFTLDALYERVGRPTFCTFLDHFWRGFSWGWDVLLGGNPAVDIYNGIKLSAGGELGVGVGEEEWGSGERAVLEDLISRTDGLVDLVVSRFGDPFAPKETADESDDERRWLGSNGFPSPSDGVVFSGVNAISRSTLARVSQWMEWAYRYGADAYGIGEDPTSPRRRKRRRQKGRSSTKDANLPPGTHDPQVTSPERSFSPGIPPPLLLGAPQSSQSPRDNEDAADAPASEDGSSAGGSEQGNDWMRLRTGTVVKYLTLGYGSTWGNSSGASSHPRVEALKREDGSPSKGKQSGSSADAQPQDASTEAASQPGDNAKPKSCGKFLVGSQDWLEKPSGGPDLDDSSETVEISHRTLHVHLGEPSEHNANVATKLRAVIYIHQPFIYTFLFDPETPSLTDHAFYQSIHHQLAPIQKALNSSTSPSTAASRISMSRSTTDINHRFTTKNQPIYDLVYDPSNLTIRSSIPNIPDLGISPADPPGPGTHTPWSRVESLNIHHRLLSTYVETRARPLETERTCKTGRGWWVIWVRMSDSNSRSSESDLSPADDGDGNLQHQEAFVIRKSSDHVPAVAHSRSGSGTRFFRDLGGAPSSPGLPSSSSRAADTGPGKLVEGLGLDARRYIENLLSLNR
ncbi:hypothetical protein P168DRAFT_252826 [Aspergillus campestris IBT 28561]|uniref:CCZ1/INTU/HSP4 first Longin domain-containing protein n=1 Tax=Aspergillus campestris (strain IBT 28561) TaxID=1392248 RepID=A0A2I1D2E0_ASPC2|nr:uncharacterized protein P168DRAFT_252826 [Aspergillus campestris IBT 28561]PKY04053.1 hypothetical protein P168DRAFT_252826 [Aspergillus campestris IBT 28561]